MIYDFNTELKSSLGSRQQFDIDLLKKVIPNCISVEKTDAETDKKGIDYIAHLSGGATINIDAKARRKGAVAAGEEPPLALEVWSVCPSGVNKGKVGWTLQTEANVDMILYTFDKDDCDSFYLIPFQHLRMAFRRNYRKWKSEYGLRRQNNYRYMSEAMFVPASVVINAVRDCMEGKVK